MDKRLSSLTVGLALVACLASAYFVLRTQTADAPLFQKQSTPYVKSDWGSGNWTFHDWDYQECFELEPHERDECLSQASSLLGKGDSGFQACALISETRMKSDCMDRARSAAAENARSATSCSVIKNQDIKESCIEKAILARIQMPEFSPEKNSPLSICEPLKAESKTYCVWRISNDGDLRIMRSSVSKKSVSECSQIKDGRIREACRSFSVANSGNSKECASIVGLENSFACSVISSLSSSIPSNGISEIPTQDFSDIPLATFVKSNSGNVSVGK